MPFAHPPILHRGNGNELIVPPTLRECPDLSPQLAELFEHCLAFDPAQRPGAPQIAAVLAPYAPANFRALRRSSPFA